MRLDIPTLYVVNVLVCGLLGGVQFFYGRTQKTYPGFGWWTAGTLVIAAGYPAMLARLAFPEWVSIVLGNGLFAAGTLLRLDGARRFMTGRPLRRAAYLSAPLLILMLAWFTFLQPDLLARSAIQCAFLAPAALVIGCTFLPHRPVRRSPLHSALFAFHATVALVLVGRIILWYRHPSVTLFESHPIHIVFLVAAIGFEICWGICFFLLNAQRLEEELSDRHEVLIATNRDLETALAEIKMLTGLLPICSGCKKIRDDDGKWQGIENYVSERSGVRISHGVCPDCAPKLYPDFFEADGRKKGAESLTGPV